MTMVASWVGVDTHGTSSAYIVSDSRFSCRSKYFDHGRKTFASCKYPEIFGYAGDVLFVSMILGQIIEMIDCDLLFDTTTNCMEKNKIIFDKISYEFNKYKELGNNSFNILHITRDTVVKGYPQFYCYILGWDSRTEKWKRDKIDIHNSSDIITVIGSGEKEFSENYVRYQNGVNSDTSRNVFHCFCDTLFNTKEDSVGGAPQLVGIIRKPNTAGKYYGIVCDNKRYLMGAELPENSNYMSIEWRNDLFEICDGVTKHKVEGAANQPDPLRRY